MVSKAADPQRDQLPLESHHTGTNGPILDNTALPLSSGRCNAPGSLDA
jgi:hypothetical protein